MHIFLSSSFLLVLLGTVIKTIEGVDHRLTQFCMGSNENQISGTLPTPPNIAFLTGKWANFKYLPKGLIIRFQTNLQAPN